MTNLLYCVKIFGYSYDALGILRKTDGGGALENLAYAGAEGARHCFAVSNLSGKRTKQLMYFTFYRNYINMFYLNR